MLYTPKKTLDLIRSLNCHFLVQVKKNTSKLYGSVRLFMALIKPFSETETFENSAGRAEHRRIEVFYNQASIPKRWGKFERLIRVTRWETRNGKDYEEISFYVSSQPIDSAKKFGQMIRQHWKIENNLHWIKDVILNEDSTTIKQTRMATTIAIFNTIILNTIRLAGLQPTKDTFAKFTNKVKGLNKLFEDTF